MHTNISRHKHPNSLYILAAAIIACALGMAGCGMAEERDIREIRDYLESRYGSQEFDIVKEDAEEGPSYKVTPAKFPEAAFTVEAGKIEESMDWNYHDDYAAQMLYGGARRLGLSCEKAENGYNVYIYYQDYSSLDSLAEKIEKLVSDCLESKAFEKLRDTCLIVIKPEGETDADFPGYQIRIETLYTYRVDKEFGVMASHMKPGQLKEDLRLCHIRNAYSCMLPKDASMFSEADIERYKAICTGATGETKEGEITIYELVNKGYYGLNFSGVYQILSSLGLVTEVSENSFTASGNEMTIRFSRVFRERESAVSYEVLSGDETLVEDERTGNAYYAVLALTGQRISFSTPEKMQAAKEAERLARLPEIQNAFETAKTQEQTGEAGGIQVTMVEMELYEILQGSNSSYMESSEKNIWTRIRLLLKNTGDTEVRVFPSVVISGSQDQFFGIIADREANLYKPTDIVGLGLEDIYGEALPAGETVEGNIYFKLPRELVSQEDALVLYYFCGTETDALLLPAP